MCNNSATVRAMLVPNLTLLYLLILAICGLYINSVTSQSTLFNYVASKTAVAQLNTIVHDPAAR